MVNFPTNVIWNGDANFTTSSSEINTTRIPLTDNATKEKPRPFEEDTQEITYLKDQELEELSLPLQPKNKIFLETKPLGGAPKD